MVIPLLNQRALASVLRRIALSEKTFEARIGVLRLEHHPS